MELLKTKRAGKVMCKINSFLWNDLTTQTSAKSSEAYSNFTLIISRQNDLFDISSERLKIKKQSKWQQRFRELLGGH